MLYLERTAYVQKLRSDKCPVSARISFWLRGVGYVVILFGVCALGAWLAHNLPALSLPVLMRGGFLLINLLVVFLLPAACIYLYAWGLYVFVEIFGDIDHLSRGILILWAVLLPPFFPFLMFFAFTDRGRKPAARPA